MRDIAAFLNAVGDETVMEYKGYVAAIEFDDSVGRLHGRVVNSGSDPIATFEATDVEGLRREFHCSIDEYLASCTEDGVEPRKPFSGKLNVRLGPELHRATGALGGRERHEPERMDPIGSAGEERDRLT